MANSRTLNWPLAQAVGYLVGGCTACPTTTSGVVAVDFEHDSIVNLDSSIATAVDSAPDVDIGTDLFAIIPEGPVYLGCDPSLDKLCADPTSGADTPGRLAQLPAFAMMRTEVTCGQWQACAELGRCKPYGNKDAFVTSHGEILQNHEYVCLLPGSENLPAREISFVDAQVFCSQMFKCGHLPSEAQWEKAARGPCAPANCADNHRSYPWGETSLCDTVPWDDTLAASCLGGSKWGLSAVGSHPNGNSPFGMSDMA